MPESPPHVSPELPEGRIAGIDFGTKRIGVAVTNADRTLASPLVAYQRRSIGEDARWFQWLVDEQQLVAFVVGLPLYPSGDESPKSREARSFADWLQQTTGAPVVMFDERFSTVQADQWMGEGQLTKRQRDQRRDMLAAQVILASFLESDRHENSTGPLEDE